jgi:hypothetical protein
MLRRWGQVGLILCVACGSDAVTGGSATDTATETAVEESSGTGPGVIPPCANAMPIMQPGSMALDSGIYQCENGFKHRVFSMDCDPTAWAQGGDCATDDPAAQCRRDADCMGDAGEQGLCNETPDPNVGCTCNFPCSNDSECPADQACYCDGIRTMCIPAACRTDSDCPTDQPCGLNELSISQCGQIDRTLACATLNDECRIDSQCLECQQCLRWIDQDRWYCSAATGVCVPCQ